MKKHQKYAAVILLQHIFLMLFQCFCCILDQKARLCAYAKSMVTCTPWMDEPVQECTCFQVHSLLLWSAMSTRFVARSQDPDSKNVGWFLCKV